MKNIPTLFEWAGDMQTFETLFTAFYAKVLKDDLLGEVFKNMSPRHIKQVSHFVAEVFGGDKLYTTEDKGSHAIMIGKHIGKMLTEEKRQRWVQILLQTADEVGLKSDPEFRSAFVGYIEWGTKLAVINSQLTENPMAIHEPMPEWGWGETGGGLHPTGKIITASKNSIRHLVLLNLLFYMNVKEQIKNYISSQFELKRNDMDALHSFILKILPGCKLWFLDGKDDKGKIVSNPNIGYGAYNIKYADGTTKEFYQIGMSANTTGISVYVMGIKDKKYLAENFGKKIGKASVTGYCIKFKTLKDINMDVLEAAIRYGAESSLQE